MTAVRTNPQQKSHAVGLARQACARVFRDGGAPVDALAAFGLATDDVAVDWSQAVEMIANALCSQPSEQRMAA